MAANQISSLTTKFVRINYIRDNLIEEFHEGVLQFSASKIEVNTPYYLRSCAKPIQASLLFDYGINLEEKEIALICGSHAGEDCHIEIAKNLLKKMELDESCLKCGIHAPLSRKMQGKMLLNGNIPSPIHNNCSGKHIGFLALCKKQGWDMKTYYDKEHPLQVAIRNKIYELCELKETYPVTTDGCGVPIVSMPLKNLIKGFQNLNKYYPQIVSAILNNPYIYGGEDRLDTEIMQNTKGILAKVGAGGLCIILNTTLNEGFAIKINDASMPARRISVLETINKLNWGNIKFDKSIKTISGKTIGYIEVEYA